MGFQCYADPNGCVTFAHPCFPPPPSLHSLRKCYGIEGARTPVGLHAPSSYCCQARIGHRGDQIEGLLSYRPRGSRHLTRTPVVELPTLHVNPNFEVDVRFCASLAITPRLPRRQRASLTSNKPHSGRTQTLCYLPVFSQRRLLLTGFLFGHLFIPIERSWLIKLAQPPGF